MFRELFKTQSDQNIHQNAPNCVIFSKMFGGSICPPNPLAYACNYDNENIFSKYTPKSINRKMF